MILASVAIRRRVPSVDLCIAYRTIRSRIGPERLYPRALALLPELVRSHRLNRCPSRAPCLTVRVTFGARRFHASRILSELTAESGSLDRGGRYRLPSGRSLGEGLCHSHYRGDMLQKFAESVFIVYHPARRFPMIDKRRARELMATAIRRGELVRQPCEVCGVVSRVHGHHDDYSQPLIVRWLCALHHRREHPGRDAGYYTEQRMRERGDL